MSEEFYSSSISIVVEFVETDAKRLFDEIEYNDLDEKDLCIKIYDAPVRDCDLLIHKLVEWCKLHRVYKLGSVFTPHGGDGYYLRIESPLMCGLMHKYYDSPDLYRGHGKYEGRNKSLVVPNHRPVIHFAAHIVENNSVANLDFSGMSVRCKNIIYKYTVGNQVFYSRYEIK